MMKKFNAIIIDDEGPARQMMKELLLEHTDSITVIGEAANGIDAIELINRLKPDLIFLDIQMPEMDGFSMLVQLSHQPLVIFTTAYEQYAIKAFEENALDYLLKPIEATRFTKSIDKVKNLSSNRAPFDFFKLKEMFEKMQPKKEITALPVKVKDKILLIRLTQLVYLKAEQGYVSLHTVSGDTYLSESTLIQLEGKLPANFIRVQKSYIINKDKIDEIHKYFNNRLIIVMSDSAKSRITTGTTYIDQIRTALAL